MAVQPERDSQTDSPPLLKVFLCHAAEDKEKVRELYGKLRADGVEPWLDEESLLPGQKWEEKIVEAVTGSDVVIVCLSPQAVSEAGDAGFLVSIARVLVSADTELTVTAVVIVTVYADTPAYWGRNAVSPDPGTVPVFQFWLVFQLPEPCLPHWT